MVTATDKGEAVGTNGVYLSGDTPASSKFITGRFVLPPGKSPHAPHTHPEEEVMIIESGHGEILCDEQTQSAARRGTPHPFAPLPRRQTTGSHPRHTRNREPRRPSRPPAIGALPS